VVRRWPTPGKAWTWPTEREWPTRAETANDVREGSRGDFGNAESAVGEAEI